MEKLYLYLEEDYIGDIFIEEIHGDEVFSFEFSDEYLRNGKKVLIDPKLMLFKGRQYDSFGFIQDMIPDRFGKVLIEKELKEENPDRTSQIKISEYLTFVSDISRMGALRIKKNQNGKFINDKDNIPPYIYLREIERASFELEEKRGSIDKNLNRLLLPGSSLGGARPKANIYFEDDIYIAKFPSKSDDFDVELLESYALEIAKKCDICVPDFVVRSFSSNGHTLLVKRFDRDKNRRIHYLSGVTALGAQDGESENYSYLDLVDFIKSESKDVDVELHELYKRMVFDYLINNTDNHLRNHAFILKDNYYGLSPMFDVNPNIYETNFALPLTAGKEGIQAIIDSSKFYNLSNEEAQNIYKKLFKIVMEELEKYVFNSKSSSKELSRILEITKKRALDKSLIPD